MRQGEVILMKKQSMSSAVSLLFVRRLIW